MVVRKGGTYWLVGLKSSIGCEHQYTWGLPWVVPGEDKFTPVEATFKWTILEAKNEVVPRIQVLLFGNCQEISQILPIKHIL